MNVRTVASGVCAFGLAHLLTPAIATAQQVPLPVAAVDSAAVARRSAKVGTPPRGSRFYTGLAWGSESQFNPLSHLLNEGFNDLIIQSSDQRLSKQPWAASWRNLLHNIGHARGAFERYGWPRAVRNELLPLSAAEGGQWLPNYTDHLIGNGMVSVRLEEWFIRHGYPMPSILAATTVMAGHVLNEVVERPQYWAVDPLADLLLFDWAGIALFRSDRVQRALSGRVRLTNWTGQPMIGLPTGTMENASQSFVFSIPLPRTERWRAFAMTGVTYLAGVTHVDEQARGISVGIGQGADVVAVTDQATDTRTVRLGFRAGLFYDRRGSLLMSLVHNPSRNGLVTLNVYPGILRVHGVSPGLWLDVRRNGVRFGLAAPFGFGAAVGPAMH
ncbi:MAG: hypothetical protein WCK74_05065 [Gemmatimonadaceae bacterium]|jgi:hypothetical protein